MSAVRVVLPQHLRRLANVVGEVGVDLRGPATLGTLLDVLEADHPVLRGTIRDQDSRRRRAFVRFFADGQDLSHVDGDEPLPAAVTTGREPFRIVGAMAGG